MIPTQLDFKLFLNTGNCFGNIVFLNTAIATSFHKSQTDKIYDRRLVL